MDFISLFITANILKRKIYKRRILFSALIGSLYGVFEVIYPIKSPILSAVISVAVSLTMTIIAYYENSLKRFITMFFMYWVTSTTLGGVMSVLYSFMNKLLYKQIENYSYAKVYNGARIFVIIALTSIFSMLFGKLYSSKKDIREIDVIIELGEKIFTVKGLCDSGNMLTEPISSRSVILVSKSSDIGKEIERTPERFLRYIPYKNVNGEGIIKGIIPKRIIIDYSSVEAVIAITDNNFAGYEALVPFSLL
jgi:sigma-E processing peptidase SpoIIGA